jgi:hypothetical protein
MTVRHMTGVVVLAVALVALGGAGTAQASTTCTWAGTPAARTGTFTVTPGVTNVPSAEPLRFTAVGELAGGARCKGRMTFDGQLDAGATCLFATFRGKVIGLPGVARFLGRGSLDVPSLLYDRAGNVVGVENAEILTEANFSHSTDCTTPTGFTGGWPGMFSSVVELY